MRVIAGHAKGRKLKAPRGMVTRPITDRVKEALFNIWQFQLEKSCFLDIFAGSGSVGIEALSRGASKAVFVDNSNEAIKTIKENLEICGLTNYGVVKQQDAFLAIRQLSNQKEKFDFIYVDPPFSLPEIFLPLVQLLGQVELLKTNGVLAIRSRHGFILPENNGILSKNRLAQYGESNIHFYNQKGDV